ncbi:hypothetical protein IWW55_004203 [Coemansia sp. RSA 2706]|nr:hypothetical protein IWW55_004203 [Coemansia sp. RSA 2706]
MVIGEINGAAQVHGCAECTRPCALANSGRVDSGAAMGRPGSIYLGHRWRAAWHGAATAQSPAVGHPVYSGRRRSGARSGNRGGAGRA